MLYIELTIVLLLTLMNGLLAMSELAVVSSRKSRLEYLANRGSKGARTALQLIDNPSRFLSTVQIGITLVGVFAGAFGGATLGKRLGEWLNTFPVFSPYGLSAGISITVLFLTFLSLIIGELVPKRIALSQPERIASLMARPMRGLSILSAPAVWLLHVSTEKVLHLMGLDGIPETTVTEDEVKSLISEGTQAGVFVPQEKDMIDGVLSLADRSVRVIMTPRTQIIWVDVNSDRDSVINMVETSRFSRLLVCDGAVDNAVGFVHTKILLPEVLNSEEFNLTELITPLLYVTDRTTVLNLLNRFKQDKVHIALVIDEYGDTEGLVTLTDVMKAIAGDLSEVGEEDGPRIVRRDDGSWLVDGTFPTDDVASVTGINMGENEEMLAGFMLDNLEQIPTEGADFTYGNARFEVIDMDGKRINKVLIEIEPPGDTENKAQFF